MQGHQTYRRRIPDSDKALLGHRLEFDVHGVVEAPISWAFTRPICSEGQMLSLSRERHPPIQKGYSSGIRENGKAAKGFLGEALNGWRIGKRLMSSTAARHRLMASRSRS